MEVQFLILLIYASIRQTVDSDILSNNDAFVFLKEEYCSNIPKFLGFVGT